MGDAWTEEEVRHAVDDYFSMLVKELRGEDYVKAEHRRALSKHLNSRSEGSIEFKHENISAVLLGLELPYIDGYKPRSNYQGLLKESVVQYVEGHRGVLQEFASLAESDDIQPQTLLNPNDVLVDPPEPSADAKEEPKKERERQFRGRHYDFPEREARNRRLGKRGEEFVISFERIRLERIGKKDLANHVEWVSETQGDGTGFDVLSFCDTGEEKFIEVKTTNYGRSFPFMITENELAFSELKAEQYFLYRVFSFNRSPKLFMLPGSIRGRCRLEPMNYRARWG